MFDFEFDPYTENTDDQPLTEFEKLDGETDAKPARKPRKSDKAIEDTKASLDVEAPEHETCPKCNGSGRWFFYKQRTWHTCARCAGYKEMNPINQERWARYNKDEYRKQREDIRTLRESGTVRNVKASFAEWTDYV